MNESQFDPIEEVCTRIAFARRAFQADLAALPESRLGQTCGGKSRCPYDLVFELSAMYGGLAALLNQGSGEIPGPQGWLRAPETFHSRATATQAFDAALDEFLAAFRDYRGDILADEYASPVGPFTPLAMANLAVWHTMYHSGQLNYIQTIDGDEAFHWNQ